MTDQEARVIELARKFCEANDRGNALDDLDGETDVDQDSLAMSLSEADADYNRYKAELFAAVRALPMDQSCPEAVWHQGN